MNQRLLSGLVANIDLKARLLWAWVCAYADDGALCAIDQAELLHALHIGERSLRDYRAQLEQAGLCRSRLAAGQIVFMLAGDATKVANELSTGLSDTAENGSPTAENGTLNAAYPSAGMTGGMLCGTANAKNGTGSAENGSGAAVSGVSIKRERERVLINTSLSLSPESAAQLSVLLHDKIPADGSPTDDEQTLTLDLLTDREIGLSEQAAQRLAAEHRFAWVLALIMQWRREITAGQRHLKPGAIVWRCDHAWRVKELTSEDHKSAFLRRHVPEWLARDAERSYYTPSAAYAGIVEH